MSSSPEIILGFLFFQNYIFNQFRIVTIVWLIFVPAGRLPVCIGPTDVSCAAVTDVGHEGVITGHFLVMNLIQDLQPNY